MGGVGGGGGGWWPMRFECKPKAPFGFLGLGLRGLGPGLDNFSVTLYYLATADLMNNPNTMPRPLTSR